MIIVPFFQTTVDQHSPASYGPGKGAMAAGAWVTEGTFFQEISQPSGQTPMSFQSLIRSMARPADWYDEGSPAITSDACEAAISLVGEARDQVVGLPLPRVAPSAVGGVSLEWTFGAVQFLIRVESADDRRVYFQREGPDFQQEDDYDDRLGVISKLLDARGSAR